MRVESLSPPIKRWWENKKKWNQWFAWRPVFVDGEWVWWETIERKMVSDGGMGSPDFCEGWKHIYRHCERR